MNRALREAVYREYMEFFERAEKNRRWNVFTDVPWEELDPNSYHEASALCAETFVGVESYLPDYLAHGIQVVRDMFGCAWFTANWGYEESKHALSLREYLVRSGQRTPQQMVDYEEAILARQWKLPFTTARQMTFYGAVQEQATFMMYRHQEKAARKRGDVVLATLYSFIGRDEAAHADFYRTVMRLELDEDRVGAIDDVALVLTKFRMPGMSLVPNYDARTEVMRRTGGVDRGVFLREVWLPTLRKVRVTREEVTKASAKLRQTGRDDRLVRGELPL